VKLVLTPNQEDVRIARFAALAIAIHWLESALPSPLPGVKPGLANVVTLTVFLLYGLRSAVWVSVLRVLVGSFVAGTFMTPAFALSFSGALASLGVLWVASRWSTLGLGAVGIAVLMAMAHMAGQFAVAYAIFVPHPGLLTVLPLLLTAALVFGLVTGKITDVMLQHWQQSK
jgi:heptaprenyl diphosphate synthase